MSQQNRFLATVLSLWLVFTQTVQAVPTAYSTGSSQNSHFYYQIGGASSILEPTHTFATANRLDGSFELGLGYSCGKFDVTSGLRNAVGIVSNLTDTIAAAAQGAISGLALLLLQRINPGLYDLVQNLIIKGEAVLALANTTCEQVETSVKKGNNPYEVWDDLAKKVDWKVQMNAGGKDVVTAKRDVQSNNGKDGVPWIGGNRAGGAGQTPINVTSDIVKAGYNLQLNRSVTDTSGYGFSSGGRKPRVVDLWATPQEAADWATQVVGDIQIATYDGHPEQATPGMGLLPSIKIDETVIAGRLAQLVSGSKKPDITNLRGVSSNDLLITEEVISSIKDLPPTEQTIAVSKLASEVSMSINFEKMIFLRRLLLSGKREPNVLQTAAVNHVDQVIAEIDREVDEILMEKRIHHELLSDTSNLMLELQNQHKNRGKIQERQPGQDVKPILEGSRVQ